MQNFQVLSSGTPHSSLFRTKTRLNDVFAMNLALRNGEYKERSGNQAQRRYIQRVHSGVQSVPKFQPTSGLAAMSKIKEYKDGSLAEFSVPRPSCTCV